MKGEQFPVNHEEDSHEIERKFLVAEADPGLLPAEAASITQGYIRVRGSIETRIRDKAGKHLFTVKDGQGVERAEKEIKITPEAYGAILPLTSGRTVDKTRHNIPLGDRTVELDVYSGGLAGLVVAEIEFDSRQDADSFDPPEWFGEEVTEDKRYKNQQLALRGLPGEAVEAAPVPEVPLQEGLPALYAYAATLRDTLQRPIVVAIAGGSASGKTSAVASRLAEQFGDEALAISLDDYYKGVSYMKRREAELGRELSFDEPEVVDLELAAEQLAALRAGGSINKPIYDFQTGERAGITTTNLRGRSIIIVEGLFALNEDLAETADVTCFVNTETHGRVIRRLLRDITRTSWSPQQILGYLRTLEEKYQEHVAPTLNNADIIINNNYDPRTEARRSGEYELQVKYPAGELTIEDLRKRGANLVTPQITQIDTFYNPPGVDLAESDEIFRLREMAGAITFGYKGPRSNDETIRERPKIELPIDQETAEGLKDLYSTHPVKTIIKQRATLWLGDVLVSYDDVSVAYPGRDPEPLGRFIELRASDKSRIEVAGRELELDASEADTRAYFDM